MRSITIYNLAPSSSDETCAEVKTCAYFWWVQDVTQMGNKLVIYRRELLCSIELCTKKSCSEWGYSFYFTMSKGTHMLPYSFLAARSFPKGHGTKRIDLQTALRVVTKYLALKITSKSRGCIVLLCIVFSSFTTRVNISTAITQRIAPSPAVYIQLHKRYSGVTRRSIMCIWAFVWGKKKIQTRENLFSVN